jgi:hypothetical protein
MDGSKDLSYRHPYVREKNFLERDVEMAEVFGIGDLLYIIGDLKRF